MSIKRRKKKISKVTLIKFGRHFIYMLFGLYEKMNDEMYVIMKEVAKTF